MGGIVLVDEVAFGFVRETEKTTLPGSAAAYWLSCGRCRVKAAVLREAVRVVGDLGELSWLLVSGRRCR